MNDLAATFLGDDFPGLGASCEVMWVRGLLTVCQRSGSYRMTPRTRMISGGKFDVCAMRLQRSLPSSQGNPVRYALGGTLPTDERKRPYDERELVENQAAAPHGDSAAA